MPKSSNRLIALVWPWGLRTVLWMIASGVVDPLEVVPLRWSSPVRPRSWT
jgi:hypothetical protein